MTTSPWRTAPPLVPVLPHPTDPSLTSRVVDLIRRVAALNPRNGQASVGASEVGAECERQLAYRLAGTAYVNVDDDPWRPMVGTAVHAYLADGIAQLDTDGALVVETATGYRDIPGTVDLYDRSIATVIDWKTTTKAKITAMRREGVPHRSRVQVQLYGAALASEGEQVTTCALAYLPLDGGLADVWVWAEPLDVDVADGAVQRLRLIAQQPPVDTTCTPSRLCGSCRFYSPSTTDVSRACPGRKG